MCKTRSFARSLACWLAQAGGKALMVLSLTVAPGCSAVRMTRPPHIEHEFQSSNHLLHSGFNSMQRLSSTCPPVPVTLIRETPSNLTTIQCLFLYYRVETNMSSLRALTKRRQKEEEYQKASETPCSQCCTAWLVGQGFHSVHCVRGRVRRCKSENAPHQPLLETPLCSYPRSFALLPALPPPRPSSRLRRLSSLTCISNTSGSSSASLSPRPMP